MSHQLQLLGRLIIQTYSLQLHLIALGQLILHHDVTTAVVIAHLDLVRTAPGGLDNDHKAKDVWQFFSTENGRHLCYFCQ
jgi:hypothetical protein